jgi:hypothetical protein
VPVLQRAGRPLHRHERSSRRVVLLLTAVVSAAAAAAAAAAAVFPRTAVEQTRGSERQRIGTCGDAPHHCPCTRRVGELLDPSAAVFSSRTRRIVVPAAA